jgi:hypothetical protein
MEGLFTISRATVNCLSNDTVDAYLELYLLLYADDTTLLAVNTLDLPKGF